MKKLIAILFSAFMLGFSTASVAGTGIAADQNGTGEGTTDTIDTTECTLLTEDVTINLSSGVIGGYDCITATNIIGVATCHPNGRNDASGNNYMYTASSAGGSVVGDQTADCTTGTAGSAATTAAGSST